MKTRRSKIEITEYILNILDHPLTLDVALDNWWCGHGKNSPGLGLSIKGLHAFKAAKITLFKFKHAIPLQISSRLIIDMQRYMTCPYHINAHEIKIAGDTENMWLQMNGGDIEQFIKNWR